MIKIGLKTTTKKQKRPKHNPKKSPNPKMKRQKMQGQMSTWFENDLHLKRKKNINPDPYFRDNIPQYMKNRFYFQKKNKKIVFISSIVLRRASASCTLTPPKDEIKNHFFLFCVFWLSLFVFIEFLYFQCW